MCLAWMVVVLPVLPVLLVLLRGGGVLIEGRSGLVACWRAALLGLAGD